MSRPEPWESGSDFHWWRCRTGPQLPAPWAEGRFFGSGRDALRALLQHGRTQRAWRRLWTPSYFCQEVAAALLSVGLEVRAYPDSPLQPPPDLGAIGAAPGDAVLALDYFGLGRAPAAAPPSRVEVIEDHTHDPWSAFAAHSRADWCVASLRKTLPLPAGGVLWSPRGHPLPPEAPVTSARETAALQKLAAMLLKGLYLDGRPVAKQAFRALAVAGEEAIGAGEVSGLPPWVGELLAAFPTRRWRSQRARNHRALSHALAEAPWVRVLQPVGAVGDVCPFSAILVLASPDLRSHLRQGLVASNVYPAILWPLEHPVIAGVAKADLDLSRRLLSLHCDMRYGPEDISRIASLVLQLGRERRPAGEAAEKTPDTGVRTNQDR